MHLGFIYFFIFGGFLVVGIYQGAVKEVLDKVLSKPIRPHFAIACIGVQFNLEVIHRLVSNFL